MFKHCNFGNHDSLNMSFNHISYYIRNILGVKELNDTQIRIIEALSPVWKLILFKRLYLELELAPQNAMIF
jgi:hypothetical protein